MNIWGCCAAGDKVGAWRGTKFHFCAASFLCFLRFRRHRAPACVAHTQLVGPREPSKFSFVSVAGGFTQGQRASQLGDALRRVRWWTANLSSRTDLPPTTPSPGLMSTARSSKGTAPSPRRSRRRTRTRMAKASTSVYLAHIY